MNYESLMSLTIIESLKHKNYVLTKENEQLKSELKRLQEQLKSANNQIIRFMNESEYIGKSYETERTLGNIEQHELDRVYTMPINHDKQSLK